MVARVEHARSSRRSRSLSGRSIAWNSYYWYSLTAPRSPSACPVPICLDPLGAVRTSTGQRQIQDVDPLSRSTAAAGRDHLVRLGQVDPLDGHRHAEHLGLERQREVVLDHGEESTALLRLVVGIDDRLLDELLEVSPARRPAAGLLPDPGSASPHRAPSRSAKASSSYSIVGSSRGCAATSGACSSA